MDVRAGGKGSAWKLCIGLAVLCGVLVFAAGFLHRNAVASAIDAQQTKSVSYVHGKLATAVGNDKLTKELGDRAAADLKKEADVPAGTDVRLYALDGTPVFSSGRPGAGDRAAITAAAKGEIGRVVDGSDLAVYASIENKGGKPIAVAAVVSDIDAVRADAAGPLDGLRLPLVALGVVLLVAGLVLMVRGGSTPGGRSVRRATQPTRRRRRRRRRRRMRRPRLRAVCRASPRLPRSYRPPSRCLPTVPTARHLWRSKHRPRPPARASGSDGRRRKTLRCRKHQKSGVRAKGQEVVVRTVSDEPGGPRTRRRARVSDDPRSRGGHPSDARGPARAAPHEDQDPGGDCRVGDPAAAGRARRRNPPCERGGGSRRLQLRMRPRPSVPPSET